MATEILNTIENEDLGIKVYVARVQGGFSVSVQDTDCGEFVGVSVVYPTEEKANAAAVKVAG